MVAGSREPWAGRVAEPAHGKAVPPGVLSRTSGLHGVAQVYQPSFLEYLALWNIWLNSYEVHINRGKIFSDSLLFLVQIL